MTTVTLKNGLVIGNFSSPHSFTFDTGEVLDRCDKEWSSEHSMVKNSHKTLSRCGRYYNSRVSFAIKNETVMALVEALESVDIMIVPFPMLKALDELDNLEGWFDLRNVGKCRTCFLTDRETKTVSSSIFCM
jgi:hypothetical protein